MAYIKSPTIQMGYSTGTDFHKALGEAIQRRTWRKDQEQRNENYRSDLECIRQFVTTKTGFEFVTARVERADITTINLRCK